MLSEDELESIHRASLQVLSEHGIEMLHPKSRELLKENGSKIEGNTVFFDPAMVEEKTALAPSSFKLHSRAAERNVTIGVGHLVTSTVGSAPNYVTLDGERQGGDRAGYRDFLKLAQQLNSIHIIGGFPVEPVDVHPSVRHLEAAYDAYTLTDRSFNLYSLHPERVRDAMEMARIVRGVDYDTFCKQPSIWTVINCNSPRRYDTPMLDGAMQLAAANQPVCYTPFTLAGAMAPITITGALVQQNAEALAGITLSQTVNPGCPVIYGGFTSNVDMRSGSPAFGTPEYAKTAIIGGQLARRYNLPYRSSNVNASNAVDAQAGYESTWALWGAINGGVNLLMHGAGWMEGGLHASYEKMVIDADLLNMAAVFMKPVEVSDASLAVDAIGRVEPGGHYFADEHTQARYQNEFLSPMVSDWRNWETWLDAGAPRADERANKIARELIASHEPPAMDEAILAELTDFVERRKSQGGIQTDF